SVFVLLRSPKTQPPSGQLPTLRSPTRVPPPLFSSCSARRKRNRPAVGCPPYDHQHVFRPLCFRLAPLAENTTAQRSVAYLTFLPYVASLRCFITLLDAILRCLFYRVASRERTRIFTAPS
ncbi:MAG: hypothetical protein LBQ66_11805, partial [Planctomycetaceae bacterium]|nr:hypothetical protein [Planctomycetaceae bacterium]